MGILARSTFVYVFVGVEVVYTCNTSNFVNKPLCYVCVVVMGMYTCNNGIFGKVTLCLCLCCFIGYAQI